MRTLKLTIAYDGTAYAGWQFQPDQPTVQETLETAIAKVTGQRVRVLASGRTDAGVHALGQVVGFQTDSALPPDVLRRALNANLPEDVAVLDVAEAPDDFHAISHVRRKRYRYVIHDGPVRDVFRRRFVWHYIHGRLDAEAMHRAAAALLGTHDFSSFETAGAPRATSVRTVFDLRVDGAGQGRGFVEEGLSGIGDWGFASGEVCSATPRDCGRGEGTVPHAERGVHHHRGRGRRISLQHGPGDRRHAGRSGPRRPAGSLGPAKSSAPPNRRAAGPTAPPQGLFLVRVEY